MLFFISENLEKLLMNNVFETMFCLHEVSKLLFSLRLILFSNVKARIKAYKMKGRIGVNAKFSAFIKLSRSILYHILGS